MNHKPYYEFIKQDETGNIKVPVSLVELEIELSKSKNEIEMKYIFKDRSYAVIRFTKEKDYILEKGV